MFYYKVIKHEDVICYITFIMLSKEYQLMNTIILNAENIPPGYNRSLS